MKRVFGLDVLRALAISLVVLSHCSYILFPGDENQFFVLSVRGLGAVGVDLFFVLSGFLIGGILLNHINADKTSFIDLFTFWKRRWMRTLPNYYLILGINIFIYLILGIALPESIFSYLGFLQNFSTPHPEFFTEAWSLSVEEYAYLLLPLVLFSGFILFKKSSKKKVFLTTTILLLIGMCVLKILYYFSTADTVQSMEAWSSGFRKVVLYRLDAVYLGFLIVFLTRNFNAHFKKYKVYYLLIGIVAFIGLHAAIVGFSISPETHPAFYAFIYLQILLLSLGLMFPYFSFWDQGKYLKRSVVFLSVRSYALYLVNYSIVFLSMQRIFDFQSLSVWYRLALVVLFLICSVLLSMAVYAFFEQPILRFRDRKFKRT